VLCKHDGDSQAELERILRAAIEARLPEPLDVVRAREGQQRLDMFDRLR
jgi:hypothetical protein